MKALSKLQSSIIVQAAGEDAVASKMSARAKMFVSVGAVVAATLAAGPADAQSGPLTPSRCAAVGATVGAALGYNGPRNSAGRVAMAAIAGLGGAAAGNWLCSPKPAPAPAAAAPAARVAPAPRVHTVTDAAPQVPARMGLSISEQERLDALSSQALVAKAAWKKALWQVDNARLTNPGSAAASQVAAADARHAFESHRAVFATAVSKLHQGAGSAPRDVGRYLEVSASLLELDTSATTSYRMLQTRDETLRARSPAYDREADRVSRLRNS